VTLTGRLRLAISACTRRAAMLLLGAAAADAVARPTATASESEHQPFVEAAFAMKDKAVRAGDQPYGAVVVQRGRIVGYGPSRVVAKNDASAHAEREAIRDAQTQLGTSDLSSCVMYSTSRPCSNCERAADARLSRMFHGTAPTDAGPPRGT
jgi:tRNA(Arg) A34 adenosine deaminase TadA